MRISHIFTPNLIDNVLKNIGEFNSLSYIEQSKKLELLKIDSCCALSEELRRIGHEVVDFYPDLELCQKKWATENNFICTNSDWKNQILLKQIEVNRPDILFFQKVPTFPKAILFKLKKIFRFIRRIVYHTAYLGASSNLDYVDILLVGTPSLVERFHKKGYKPELFYHYFDSSILNYFNGSNYSKNFQLTFLGSSGFGGGYLHADRYFFLKFLAENSNLQMWVNEPIRYEGNDKTHFSLRKNLKKLINFLPSSFLLGMKDNLGILQPLEALVNECIQEKSFNRDGRKLPDKPLRALFPDKCFNGTMGIDYYKIMYQSKISFTKACNNISDGFDNNKGDIGAIRLFEATGLGSCLIADTGPNMGDLFEEGKEIVTYTTKEEALDKIKFLQENETQRKEIAKHGQIRTLRDHTEKNRAQQFDLLIQNRS